MFGEPCPCLVGTAFCVREQAQLAPEVLADTGQHGLVLMF